MPAEPARAAYTWDGGKFHHYALGNQHVSELELDLRQADPAAVGSVPLQLMGLSALHCMAGTVAAFLQGRGAVIHALTGRVSVEQGTNDQRRVQVSKMTVELDVAVDDKDADLLDKAERIIAERGCLATYSFERGFEVENIIRRVSAP